MQLMRERMCIILQTNHCTAVFSVVFLSSCVSLTEICVSFSLQ